MDRSSLARLANVRLLAAVFVVGALLRMLVDGANHHGPSFGGWSLQGNGALIFVPLFPVVVLAAAGWAVYRRSWIALVLMLPALGAGIAAGGLVGL